MYVQHNNEARSCDHCYSGKAVIITSSELCFEPEVSNMHSACAIFYGHLSPAPLYNIFPRYLINGMILEKKVIEFKMCVLIFYMTYLKHFPS
jgi:hypothetical protein